MTEGGDFVLPGRRVVVPGGTGGVGEGVVRRYLAAGADVVVPTRSPARAEEFRRVLGDAAIERLHLVVHDYASFAGAQRLAEETTNRLGGVDAVVAPIGGWWAGKRLWEIDETDWQDAFVELTTTHLAVLRAFVPRLGHAGSYTLVVGESAEVPVPGSGLVSMEQAALLMMWQVLHAELAGGDGPRAFALLLGPVRTRSSAAESDWISADQVGAITAALTATPQFDSQTLRLHDSSDADKTLDLIRATA